jgi:hypothetical protein
MIWLLVVVVSAVTHAGAFMLGLKCKVERDVNSEVRRRLDPIMDMQSVKRVTMGPDSMSVEYHVPRYRGDK